MMRWLHAYLSSRRGKFFLALAMLITLVELALRFAHFRFEPDREFGYPRAADFGFLQYDPDLFWKINPNQEGINSWGFPGREINPVKPEGVYRMVFLGDSILYAGYPFLVEQCLHDAEVQVEVIPLAVPGYSSYQGHLLAEKFGALLKPDLVVVQFGWNDHWLAYGEPDAQKTFSPPRSWSVPFHVYLYDRVRILQGLGWVGALVFGKGKSVTEEVRVPPAQYQENLRAIQATFEKDQTPVVFVTAPSAHPKLGVPEEIVQNGFAVGSASVLQLHQVYNQIVREIAGEDWVFDLQAEFDTLSEGDLKEMFQPDGIHPTEMGTAEIASGFCRFIRPFLPTSIE